MGTLTRLRVLAVVCLSGAVVACSDDAAPIADARPVDATGFDASTTDATDLDAVSPDAVPPDAVPPDAMVVDGDLPPGPITAFTASNVPAGLTLTWTNPGDADLAGVLVVAGVAPITFAPQNGMTYTVGTVVAANEAVIHASLATMLANFQGLPGVGFHFAGWARDAAGQYSTVATTTGRTDVLGTQVGQIQVFLNGNVVVTQQPPALLLSGAATVSVATGTIDLDLTAQNRAGRLFFNLKALVDSTSDGTVTNSTFPATAGLPMAYYGPAALAPGLMRGSTISLTGITGAVDPVVLTVHFVDAPALVLSTSAFKGGTGTVVVADSSGDRSGGIDAPSQSCGAATARGGAVTADQRYVFTGAKSTPRLSRYDLATFSVMTGPTLTTVSGTGGIADVFLSADETRVYGILTDSYHANRGGGCTGGPVERRAPAAGSGDRRGVARVATPWPFVVDTVIDHGGGGPTNATVALVEFDAQTLAELRRLPLTQIGTIPRSLPTVTRLAPPRVLVASRDGVVNVVDLATFTELDTDAATMGIQPLSLGIGKWLPRLAVAPGGGTFAAASVDAGVMTIRHLDAATLATTDNQTVPMFDASTVRDLRYAPGGRLLAVVDGNLGGDAVIAQTGTGAPAVLHTLDNSVSAAWKGNLDLFATRNGDVHVFDRATDTEVDTDGDAGNGVTPLSFGASFRPHGLFHVTPY